jgi:Xaa-Pro aminopeptidase
LLLNTSRALDCMRQAGVDAVVAVSPPNVTYLSGYTCWVDRMKEYMFAPGGSDRPLTGTLALLTAGGERSLVVSPLFAANAAQLSLDDIRIYGDPREIADRGQARGSLPDDLAPILEKLRRDRRPQTPVQALAEALRDHGLDSGRLAVELTAMGEEARAELAGALPDAELLECANLLRLVRTVKSTNELRQLAQAAEINELAATECLTLARPGGSTKQLLRHYRSRVAELGAVFDHLAFGIGGLGIATEVDYRFRPGDVLYVDFGCVYEGCFSDSGRTLSIGEPPPELVVLHDALRDCVEAGRRGLRPGRSVSDVWHEMREVLDRLGVSASNPHGHSLGLEVREHPIVAADSGERIADECVDIPAALVLEEGMVINLESALFLPGEASLHVEMTFTVTSGEAQPIAPHDRARPFIAGDG